MEPVTNYNLLQSIDPTKIKVPISDRFAKLTLSSNKKKQHQQKDPDEQKELEKRLAKRESVSRNITKQFAIEATEVRSNMAENPILRSESSKDTDQKKYDELCGEEEELTMDALQVSDDDDYENPTPFEEDVEILSQMVSGLVVGSAPISISSGSTDNLVSTESQHSSTSAENHLHVVRHIPINVKEALEQDTISLNLTNTTENDVQEKTYEMTDDEDEFVENDDEGDEAITISDSSEGQRDQEQDVMATSSLPSDSQTIGLLLPSLTDDKAERVAAFLRDVSIERRAMMEQGKVNNDTIDRLIDNKEIDRIQEALNRSRQIATADTESMTPDCEDEEVTPKPAIERDRRMKSFVGLIDNKMKKNIHNLSYEENQDNTEPTNNNAGGFSEERTPKNNANKKTNIYNIACDETQSNLDFSISELIETPKIQNNINKKTPKENKDNSRRLANIETEENTIPSITESILKANEDTLASSVDKKIAAVYDDDNPHRLANEDTMTNSVVTGIEEAMSQVYNYTNNNTTPEKSYKEMKSSSLKSRKTIHESIINSSSEHNVTTPEDSIVISETDDENIREQQQSPKSINSDDNKKLSNSLHNDETSSSSCDGSDYDNGQMAQLQMSMAKINISAKINIKIHIPTNFSIESSDDDDNDKDKAENKPATQEEKEEKNVPKETGKQLEKERLLEKTSNKVTNRNKNSDNTSTDICNQMQLNATKGNVLNCLDISSSSVEVDEDENFLTEAERLLNQLYGKSWQTPDVLRTLKRCGQSTEKKANNSRNSSKKKNNSVKSLNDPKSGNKSTVEESILDDFSIFQRNIVKTNLDSTRFVTPKMFATQQNKQVLTEPRNAKPLTNKNDDTSNKKPAKTQPFQTPVAKVVRNRRRVEIGRWRHLIDDDSNSEGDNASDDDDADESWSKNASEIEDLIDSDLENSLEAKGKSRKVNTTKTLRGRNNKSAELAKRLNKSKEDELVYLDLSKEEVEIQEHVPESPPANHDATFASRLQDILKTCRHEDKAKLPSSTKKTKRKLFTANFGNDDFEGLVFDDKEQTKEHIAKPLNNKKDEEIIEDLDICPFDSQGRPKLLDLFNKPLESVKTGKPIFQLTPPKMFEKNKPLESLKTGKPIFQLTPPKKFEKATPLSNKDDRNTKESGGTSSSSGSATKSKRANNEPFKTPLTVKSKQPAKSLQDLSKTPDYKYSFLKSLEVTVSKSFCHPDALYYRDNYRTKKEDLSKILYDLYNEKLFENKLNVPITWNKKLSNTAGRCLNRKRMGIRSSAIELSEKVLTSGDRLRCTLIHELCHAATWIFNGEGGHGNTWKMWARRANATFPEIPKIGVCHQYDIEYKYTYKCTLCGAKSHAHSKSKKVENIRCSYCHGAIEIFLNKKDKDGNIMPTPVKEPTGFAKFVKDNYKKFKRDDLKHADVMKLLSNEFASLKVAGN